MSGTRGHRESWSLSQVSQVNRRSRCKNTFTPVGHFTLGSSSNRPVHRRMKPVGSSCSNISTFHWLDLRSRKQIIQFQFCFFFRFVFFVSGGSGWNCNVNREAWNFGLRPPSCLSIPSSHRFFQVWAKGPFQKTGSKQTVDTNPKSESSLFIVQESGISRKSFKLQSLSRAWKLSIGWLMSSETWPQCRFSSQSDKAEITVSSRRGLILLAPSAFRRRRQQQQATPWLYAASEWLEKKQRGCFLLCCSKTFAKDLGRVFSVPQKLQGEKQITVRSFPGKIKVQSTGNQNFSFVLTSVFLLLFSSPFLSPRPQDKRSLVPFRGGRPARGGGGAREARSSSDVYEIIGAGRDVFAAITICSLASALREA